MSAAALENPGSAIYRCVHCSADLAKVPLIGWVHPDGQRAAMLPDGEIDHLALPVGAVRGLPRHLGLVPA